jgi:membrane-bound metal-dependent hydrolase YbcI (DUF457 family)
MASYRGHLAFSSILGSAYGSAAVWLWRLDWGEAVLGATLTTLGGLLPDLDSESGVPVRELFGAAAAVVPFMVLPHLHRDGLSMERTLVIMIASYVFIRYVVANLFKRYTVHRGMFHSIPALFISGLATYLLYQSPHPGIRILLAGGVMLGFLSHLVLDELYSVDFNGLRLRLNKFAGSALKLGSKSYFATGITYLLLVGLVYLVLLDWAKTV